MGSPAQKRRSAVSSLTPGLRGSCFLACRRPRLASRLHRGEMRSGSNAGPLDSPLAARPVRSRRRWAPGRGRAVDEGNLDPGCTVAGVGHVRPEAPVPPTGGVARHADHVAGGDAVPVLESHEALQCPFRLDSRSCRRSPLDEPEASAGIGGGGATTGHRLNPRFGRRLRGDARLAVSRRRDARGGADATRQVSMEQFGGLRRPI